MKKLLIILFFASHIFANQQTMFQSLEQYFITIYEINPEKAISLASKFDELKKIENYPLLINEFITKSYKLYINSSTSFTGLLIHDAVEKASQWHEILFENNEIRILWTIVKPGEQESFHMHYWKSILVIMNGAHFTINYADGSIEKDWWPCGIYELPADIQPASYTNTADSEFRALRFEVK